MNKIAERIKELKKERGALILAHNYTEKSVQDIADFTGDSLELAIRAKELQAELLVFCGVSFMAETAKILSPGSKVLLPVPSAGCPMAEMATAEAVRAYREKHPDTVIVAYVNTTAAVKAEVDICCTSANAEKIVSSIPADKKILFLPDRNLGSNVAKALGREMDLWPGYCPIHDALEKAVFQKAKDLHPQALSLVHPECRPELLALADKALSTGAMLRYLAGAEEKEFIVGTEEGILHRMEKENPGKTFYSVEPRLICEDMKKITLKDVLHSLEEDTFQVELAPELIRKAALAIERMIAVK